LPFARLAGAAAMMPASRRLESDFKPGQNRPTRERDGRLRSSEQIEQFRQFRIDHVNVMKGERFGN
jgi:hypothetical protein